MKGIIFDIKEFALNDGAGIRTTVFFKGCPLRCIWCHNPEGQKREKELMRKHVGCTHCGLCRRPCSHPDCQGLGDCLHICPQNLIKTVGVEWESEALAKKIRARSDLYRATGGGVTLSGGEPLMQPDFACALLDALQGLDRAVETCGYAREADFARVCDRTELVIMDLKLADPSLHKQYTGVDNDLILTNAKFLKASGKRHIFRVPLIPEITDTEDNLRRISEIAGDSRVELLTYNKLAPVKYETVGRTYTNLIRGDLPVHADPSIFQNAVLLKH